MIFFKCNTDFVFHLLLSFIYRIITFEKIRITLHLNEYFIFVGDFKKLKFKENEDSTNRLWKNGERN